MNALEKKCIIDFIIAGYTDAIIFTESSDENRIYSDSRPSVKARQTISVICRQFYKDNTESINTYMGAGVFPTQIGHDLWLTSKGHGAGFWDKNILPEIEALLTTASKKFEDVNVFATKRNCFLVEYYQFGS